MSAYASRMSLRTLFAALVAMTVLFAPAMARAGEVFAAVPDHHAQMMQSGHCKMAPSDSTDGKSSKNDKAGMACCISMCMAVAVTPPAPPQVAEVHGSAATFPLTHQYHGLITEIATPPPRLA